LKSGVFFSAAKPPSRTTIWRWIKNGVRGVKLIPHRVGGRVYVTREAALEFDAALNPVRSPRRVVESSTARAKAASDALGKLGM
jgi:hypothetical protein